MFRILKFALAALLIVAAPLRTAAQDAADPIEAVIAQQLEAFNDRDVAAAFDFASPMIQDMFGTAETFGTMVADGYPMVWTNDGARFLGRESRGGRQVQRVMVTDAAGAIHILDYTMLEAEGGWQIDGVSIVPAPDVGV